MKTTIIAGFPGVGKTYAAKHIHDYPEFEKMHVVDLESSEYGWIYDENGQKIRNPEWPKNYVDAIIEQYVLSSNLHHQVRGKKRYILISTHQEVLESLAKIDGIDLIIFKPKTKKVAMQRYVERGSSKEFIKSIDENWDKYMKSLDCVAREFDNIHLYISDEPLLEFLTV